MADCAIIFDVDGVLLNLTPAEEELFFQPFATFIDVSKLSRDWNSYRIRNDENIIAEIVERYNLPQNLCAVLKTEYLNLLAEHISSHKIMPHPIKGAAQLLAHLKFCTLGIATANFRDAAKLRLVQAGLWQQVQKLAYGADGGGAKSEILSRALASLNLPATRIVYVGDNLNDVAAGLNNNVHFIGFSENEVRRHILAKAGAQHISANHTETLALIAKVLGWPAA
jgi:phosphoglycolate phosphatase-like HAD superfamily hydrolase